MKFIRAGEGYEIRVGDYILIKSMLDKGYRSFRVHRVTAKFAFCKYNDVAEGKFPRVFTRYGFHPSPRTEKFQTTEYVVGIVKPEEKESHP
jgi:hypothetical protein